MKNNHVFIFTMLATACVAYSGQILTASNKADASRPLTKSLGVAVIDGCDVSGRLVRRSEGVYAVFSVTNPSDESQAVEFQYAVNHKGAEMLMSRMGPIPRQKKAGTHKVTVAAMTTAHEEILIEATPAVKDAAKKPAIVRSSSPATWSIIVSRGVISPTLGFGATAPAIKDGRAVLETGQLMIARTELPAAPVVNPNKGV
jgi:hypothetical protein